MAPDQLIPKLLAAAWLLPLIGFAIEIFGGYWQPNRKSKAAALMAVGCIGMGFILSLSALCIWGNASDWAALKTNDAHHTEAHHDDEHHAEDKHHDKEHDHKDEKHAANHNEGHHKGEAETKTGLAAGAPISGTFYTLATFGTLELSVDYYVDSLTIVMFVMVTLIATCIHIFALGYMSEELTDDLEDHQVHLASGKHFHRPGRFYLFFAFMSLFCFSMLGLVLAGNIFQVFVFWELVGVCSYLLIGFYTERHTASTAANKAFIMNRVGDFGFLIGLMILFTYCGTFRFKENDVAALQEHVAVQEQVEAPAKRAGLFQQVRPSQGDGIIKKDAQGNVTLHAVNGKAETSKASGRKTIPYWLLIVAGLGVFGGCIGKSAQFPLQTWLPDAMEGPTPVSALVHSATMVAAGVYLVGRFTPVFTPEVLLVIAYIGCITLFLGATIAVVATDIKKVLAYSTISQLGYMMLALGLAGWGAGLFHLITHAFFKSLMFLASGSVIYGCHHVQEMPRMGGLRKKMPITAYTMLVGVIAICGLSIVGISPWGEKLAFSGYHSKDAIVATALAYMKLNPIHFLLFLTPLITAGITAFYMFRMWFYTFAGTPRDQKVYDHCHESPWVMTVPLLILSFFAAFVAFGGEQGVLYKMLTHSEPSHIGAGLKAATEGAISLPSHHDVHASHSAAGMYASAVAFLGLIVAWVLYGAGIVDPGEIKKQLKGVHHFLEEKWHFDTLYDVMFVYPSRVVASWCSAIDKYVFDEILHRSVALMIWVSKWDRLFDELVIDGFVNTLGNTTQSIGQTFRYLQTGKLRQYVMFIAMGVIALFVVIFALFPK